MNDFHEQRIRYEINGTHFEITGAVKLCLKEFLNIGGKAGNKTGRIRAKPLMFRLPFRVYGAAVKNKKI